MDRVQFHGALSHRAAASHVNLRMKSRCPPPIRRKQISLCRELETFPFATCCRCVLKDLGFLPGALDKSFMMFSGLVSLRCGAMPNNIVSR